MAAARYDDHLQHTSKIVTMATKETIWILRRNFIPVFNKDVFNGGEF